MNQDTHDKLRRVQDLLRHSIPNGDPAAIFERALTLLLAELERQKCATTSQPREISEPTKRSRHIPASVRRGVWSRDDGRCAFVGTDGRCTERGFLEFHHVQPYAAGGATTIANVELRCRAHNQYEADLLFGDPLIARETRSAFVIDSVRTDFVGSVRSRVEEFGLIDVEKRRRARCRYWAAAALGARRAPAAAIRRSSARGDRKTGAHRRG